jgi:hypothetical protein
MVDTPLMIHFREATIICPLHVSEDGFPRWIYNLTPINELPSPDDAPTYLIGTFTC